MKWVSAVLVVAALTLAFGIEAAVFEPRDFESAAKEARYKTLVEELRCLVCQNQNLADSNAELAGDLRRQVYTMIADGASDGEIVDFMVARYGDFVLYRPPLKPATVLLWAGPFLLGTAALAFLVFQVRRRNKTRMASVLSASEKRRVTDLLESSREPKDNG